MVRREVYRFNEIGNYGYGAIYYPIGYSVGLYRADQG